MTTPLALIAEPKPPGPGWHSIRECAAALGVKPQEVAQMTLWDELATTRFVSGEYVCSEDLAWLMNAMGAR